METSLTLFRFPSVCESVMYFISIRLEMFSVLSQKHANQVRLCPHTRLCSWLLTSCQPCLIQRPYYQRGSPCQDPASNWTIRRPPDHRKEMQTEVVWPCLPFIRSGQNHLARHSEAGKKTKQKEEEVGRQHQRMDRPGVRQIQVENKE